MSKFKDRPTEKCPMRSLDETVMKGVNAGVRVWNWTTGGTKASLANTILVASLGLEMLYQLRNPRELDNLIVTVFQACVTPFCVQNNLEVHALEENALQRQTLDRSVEHEKTFFYMPSGYFVGAAALVSAFVDRRGVAPYPEMGFGLASISFQVMRADPVPPRKDVISRTVDKTVVPLLRKMMPQPVRA